MNAVKQETPDPESLEKMIESISNDGPLLAVTPDPIRQNFRNLGLSELWAGVGSTAATRRQELREEFGTIEHPKYAITAELNSFCNTLERYV